MASISVLPIWKKDATAAERLSELASYALANPERFDRFVICYRERLPSGNLKYRYLQFGCDIDQMVGMFEIGKSESLKDSET